MEQQKLPNATLIIVLGILGYLCCCFAALGIIPSGIAFFMATKSQKLYEEKPEVYDNYNIIKTGKIVALIALILNILMIINVIYVLSTVGWEAWSTEFSRRWTESMESGGNY
ncbi:CCC motif membrane protein [Cellulophaga sp. L1A9]|uniref:CCC motif membrane protein n=1 Tax=Cellulophaga sp. L1A9 TaxID=2686362 RepID=UPI00131E79C9|nr:CCC motif membrane protein [Cellulophaga sp. L1A9]